MTVPRPTGLPGAGDDLRGRPARRAAERDGARPDRGQGGVRPPPAGGRAAGRRGDQLRAPAVGAAARRRRRADDACSGDAGPRPARCWCPTSAASTGRWSWAAGTSRSSAAPPRRSRSATSTAASTSSSRCSSPTVRRARDAGLDVRAYVSMCFGDPWEGAVPIDAGGRRRPAAASTSAPASSASATPSASAPPATSRALLDAFSDAGTARRRRSPCTSTTPTARRWPTRTAGAARRHHDVRRQRRRPRRLPLRQERDRQPRHRGPGLAAHRPRHRARRRPRRAGRDLHLDGRPARPPQPLARSCALAGDCRRRRAEFRP